MNKVLMFIVFVISFASCDLENINTGFTIPLKNGESLTVVRDQSDYCIILGNSSQKNTDEMDRICVNNSQFLTLYYFIDNRSEILVVDEGNMTQESQFKIQSEAYDIKLFSVQEYFKYREELRGPKGFLPIMGRLDFDFHENYVNHFKGKTYRW
ncbi:MAG: hypothetical protein ACPG6V_07045 [Flavobacteriales bacterium]